MQSFEGTSWRVHEDVRPLLIEGLKTTDRYERLSLFLGDYFTSIAELADDESSRDARIALWRAGYHYVEVKPDRAAYKLVQLVTSAASCERFTDVEVAIDLFETQRSLASYTVELEYARGRLAYAREDYAAAHIHFGVVWAAARGDQPTVIAGHLLAVIELKTGDLSDHPVQVLRRASTIAGELNDDLGRAHTLATLVNALLENPRGATTYDIEKMAQESAMLQEDMGPRAAAVGFTTLAQAQVRSGKHRFAAALASFELAAGFAEQAGDSRTVAMVFLSWSWLARTQGDLARAAALVERALIADISRGPAARTHIAKTATRLVGLLGEMVEQPGDWTVLESSNACLAYVHEGRLVIVRRQAGADRVLSLPDSLHGRWRDPEREIVEIGAPFRLGELLKGRPGAFLYRIRDSGE